MGSQTIQVMLLSTVWVSRSKKRREEESMPKRYMWVVYPVTKRLRSVTWPWLHLGRSRSSSSNAEAWTVRKERDCAPTISNIDYEMSWFYGPRLRSFKS